MTGLSPPAHLTNRFKASRPGSFTFTTRFFPKMNFFMQFLFVLASTALAANCPASTRFKLSGSDLLVMRDAIIREDSPETNFPSLMNHGRITGPCDPFGGEYSMQELLEEAILSDRVESFIFLYSRAHDSFGVDAFGLFKLAFGRDNLQICDFLMVMNPSFNGVDFSRRYRIGDLRKLSERYSYRDHLFLLRNVSWMNLANYDNIMEAIDYIEYCGSKGYQFSPTELLSIVLENESLFDEDMFRIVERLLEMGAKVDVKKFSEPTSYEIDPEEEFKALYPKTYEILFGDKEYPSIDDFNSIRRWSI